MGIDFILHKMSVTFLKCGIEQPKKVTNPAHSEKVRDL